MDKEALYREELEHLAAQLRRWADESEKGGWSTHQVKPMREQAEKLEALLYRTR